MSKVTVVGAGNVGATVANVLAHKDLVKEVVLLDIQGDLAGLYQGQVSGRQAAEDITVFKSVGHAAEDLAAATLLYEQSK